jgi:hypothetical protein
MPSLSSPAEIASSVSNTTAENPVAFTENFAKISQRGGATRPIEHEARCCTTKKAKTKSHKECSRVKSIQKISRRTPAAITGSIRTDFGVRPKHTRSRRPSERIHLRVKIDSLQVPSWSICHHPRATAALHRAFLSGALLLGNVLRHGDS